MIDRALDTNMILTEIPKSGSFGIKLTEKTLASCE